MGSPNWTAQVIVEARRLEVHAELLRVRRLLWTPLEGSWSRFELQLAAGSFALYVDRRSRPAAAGVAAELG
jgi:hypothetical protein